MDRGTGGRELKYKKGQVRALQYVSVVKDKRNIAFIGHKLGANTDFKKAKERK